MPSYPIFLVVLAMLAVASQSPVLVLLGLALGFIPGLILLASNTFLLYALAIFPVFVFFRESGRRFLRPALAIAVVALIAFLPGFLSRIQFAAYVRQALASDHVEAAGVAPRSVELPIEWGGWQRPSNAMHGNFENPDGGRPRCGDLCQNLLYNGGLDSVFVIYGQNIPGSGVRFSNPPQPWRFFIERRDRCPETLSQPKPEFQTRIGFGECLIEEKAVRAEADVVLVTSHREMGSNVPRSDCTLYSRLSLWLTRGNPLTIEVRERIGDSLAARERRTQVEGYLAPRIFYIGFHGCQQLEMRPQIASEITTVQTADPTEMLERRYGLRLSRSAFLAQPSHALEFQAAMRILDRSYPPGEYVSDGEAGFIRKFVEATLDQASLSSSDIAALRALIRQSALTNHYMPLGRRAPRHQDALASLLPDMMDRLEAPVQSYDYMRWDIAGLMASFPADVLRPYVSRLGNLLSDPVRGKYAAALLRRWGDLVDDPKPLLLGVLAGPEGTRQSALIGLCRWASPSHPELAETFLAFLRNTKSIYSTMDAAVIGLIRLGQRKSLEAFASQVQDPPTANRMKLFLSSNRDDVGPQACR